MNDNKLYIRITNGISVLNFNSIFWYKIIAISKEINKTLSLKLNSIQHITSLLTSYGLKDVLNKHSHSTRHVYWFNRPLCLNTFKVPNI